jgi:hypothetical protein
MQAMAAMGVLGGPGGAQQPPDLGMAKHLIDLLGVIEEKTRGNLSQDEAGMLEQMLHQLRVLSSILKSARTLRKPVRVPKANRQLNSREQKTSAFHRL